MWYGVVVGLAAAVIVLLGVVSGGSAAGASCLRASDVEEDLQGSDLVFVGTVTNLSNDDRWATFRVEEVWKGDPGSSRVEVRAGPAGGPGAPAATSADRTYADGRRYLVFASDLSRQPGAGADFGEGARWVDGSCSATRIYQPDLDRFRPAGARPVPSEATSGRSVPTAVIVAVVVLAGAVATVVCLRRNWVG